MSKVITLHGFPTLRLRFHSNVAPGSLSALMLHDVSHQRLQHPPNHCIRCVMQDILAYNCEESADGSLPFPIIADHKRELAVALGMLDPVEKDKDGLPLTARCVSL